MAFVEIENLWVRYRKFDAVRGITFEIPRGEVFGFIGPNGAGKTSTLRVLATLQQPARGTARIDGVDVQKDPYAIRRRIGYMPEQFGVYEDLTVSDYLHFFAAAYRLDPSRRDRTVKDVLELTDLTDKQGAMVEALSRGMKQRLGLARVLLHDPDFLILDEPASGLDPRARIEIRELLKAMKDMGKTILISSHILHELAQLCTSIGIVEAGELVAQGSLTSIYRRLGLQQVVHVQLANSPDGLPDRLREVDGVTSVEEQIDRYAVHIRQEELPPEALLEKILALGGRVRLFQPEAMDMETAFMKLTEGKTA